MMNPLILGAGASIVVGALGLALLGGESRAHKRQAALVGPRKAPGVVAAQTDRSQRKKQIAADLREFESANRRRVTLAAKIEQAGLAIEPRHFIAGSVVFGLVAGLLVFLESGSVLLAGLLAVVAGGGAPRWMLRRMRRRRIDKFIMNFPTAIDLIVRGVRAGLPLGDTIRIASTESAEPVRTEFRKVVEAGALGLTLPEAVERMAQRVPITETNFFSIVIAIQGKAGGNLSEAVGNLSRVLRERKKMKGKIAAMSMEAKASAVIIGAVPFLVVGALYVSSPNYVSLLWTTTHGRLIAAIALGWMAIGFAMMKKMISFDF